MEPKDWPALKAKLLEAMEAVGVPADGLEFSYSEDLVAYPGGGYANRLITVRCGNASEQFCAVLTEKNPLVTAIEIGRTFCMCRRKTGAGAAYIGKAAPAGSRKENDQR